ncbi:MAG TPA: hypothetical protein VNY33_03845 [Gaiellaceae bacterium]|jgi:hypothetical protein|nr:hypothetical protein [Gaiellaceae bacterium]
MALVRRLLAIALAVSALSACGGSKHVVAAGLSGATGRTVAAKTASFTLGISATIGSMAVQSSETGSLSFSERRAHFYKLVPGGGTPQEVVIDGPIEYTNANIDAALNDPTVKPWTKLDTRRVPPAQLRTHPDELAHVRVVAYLANGVGNASRVGTETIAGEPQIHYRGVVDPARVVAAAPASERAALRMAIGNDYLASPFPADFWVDSSGRVRRVLVGYRTAHGSQIVIDARFSDFGVKVDLTVPPAADVQNISP